MSIVDPLRKHIFQFVGNPIIFLFTKISQIDTLSMCREPMIVSFPNRSAIIFSASSLNFFTSSSPLPIQISRLIFLHYTIRLFPCHFISSSYEKRAEHHLSTLFPNTLHALLSHTISLPNAIICSLKSSIIIGSCYYIRRFIICTAVVIINRVTYFIIIYSDHSINIVFLRL